MNILLIAGGWSPEREISLIGAAAIREALARRGHKITQYDLSDGFEPLLELAESHDARPERTDWCRPYWRGQDAPIKGLIPRVPFLLCTNPWQRPCSAGRV